jgi:hypothetical protein
MNRLKRRVEPGNILVSDEQPRMRIRVDQALRYVGGIGLPLSGVAWAEIHSFVETDGEKRLLRRFHVQFEHFLPDNDHTYNYRLPDTITVGAHEWMHNPGGYPVQLVFDTRPDSDMAAGYNFLKGNGYVLPDEVFYRRFLRTVGDDRRAEIIMVYSENAALTGVTVADYDEGGRLHDAAATFHDALLRRALAAFEVIEAD